MRRVPTALSILASTLALTVVGHAAPGGTSPSTDPALALAAIDRRLADLDVEQQTDRSELGRVGEQLAVRHARVLARGRAFYRLTRAGLLPIGGGFGSLVTHAMRVERIRRVLASEIDEEAAQAAAQDEQRRQAAFEKAFETSTGAGGGYVAVTGALSPDTPAGGFATARGRLLLPLVGRAEINPARREGTEGAGLELRAAAGSPVRAVFAGRVIFADRYGPYGRLVILDHGDHYYTVSGNLDEIDVKIGQDVGAGERIGTVGDDGRGAMLYFEVRHGSRTIPPKEWLGI
jgi:murein DD-endopeptidase MepM/ murein hydrolase activator NlpD